MILIYRPEGGDEQRWDFDLARCKTKEREQVEKRTGLAWGAFKAALAEESTLATKGLLWMLLRRAHPTYRWEDVEFCDDEIELVITSEDYRKAQRDIEASRTLSAADKAEALAEVERLIAEREAVEAEHEDVAPEGKAPASSDDTTTP